MKNADMQGSARTADKLLVISRALLVKRARMSMQSSTDATRTLDQTGMASAESATAAICNLDLTDDSPTTSGPHEVDDHVVSKHLLPLLGVRHLSVLSQVDSRLNRLCLHEFKRLYLEAYSGRKDPLLELRDLEWYRSELLEQESRR